MYTSEKVQVLHCLGRPETHFQHQRRNQRAGAITGYTNITRNTNKPVNGVEHQKRVNIKKLDNRLIGFQKNSNSLFITTFKKSKRKTHKYEK